MTGPRSASRRRDQSGYTLLIVLMACGLFAVMLMSLLAMVGTDARALSAYTSADAAKRAVDGATLGEVVREARVEGRKIRGSPGSRLDHERAGRD